MLLVPNRNRMHRRGTFWLLSPELIVNILGILGFEDSKVSFHKQKARGQELDMFTVVANRTCDFDPMMRY